MNLNIRAYALAAGVTAAVLFSICAFAVAMDPTGTTAFFSFITHIDMNGLARPLDWGSYFGGLVAWTLGTALTFGLAAWLYNRLVKP